MLSKSEFVELCLNYKSQKQKEKAKGAKDADNFKYDMMHSKMYSGNRGRYRMSSVN